MKFRVIKYLLLFLPIILSLNCGAGRGKQAFADDYTSALSRFMTRTSIIKKGQEAVIAYRRSNFNDIENAEIARESFMQGMSVDSAALNELSSVTPPDSASKEIKQLLKAGIESVSKGTAVFAHNYARAKDQDVQQRRLSIMNVRPGLSYLGKGYNMVVKSITALREYIKKNDLDEKEDLQDCFKYFETERDNLSSFLKEE